MLREIYEIVRAVFVLMSFLVTLAELLYEDDPKSGAQKKAQVLAWWKELIGEFRSMINERFGDRGLKVLEWLGQDKVASFIVDAVVFVFNAKGLFRQSGKS